MGREAKKCQQCGKQIYFEGLCISCQMENQRKKILALSPTEIEAEIQQICQEIETTGQLEQKENLFKKLVNYRDIDTTKIAKAAFSQKLFYPYQMYKNAPPEVIQSMFTMLKQKDSLSTTTDNMLLCLAVHGGKEVLQGFLELENKEWTKKLYTNLSSYATFGGWFFDNNGNFLKTIFDQCYLIQKTTQKKAALIAFYIPMLIFADIPLMEKVKLCLIRVILSSITIGRKNKLQNFPHIRMF